MKMSLMRRLEVGQHEAILERLSRLTLNIPKRDRVYPVHSDGIDNARLHFTLAGMEFSAQIKHSNSKHLKKRILGT